jgi:hypothetical protein
MRDVTELKLLFSSVTVFVAALFASVPLTLRVGDHLCTHTGGKEESGFTGLRVNVPTGLGSKCTRSARSVLAEAGTRDLSVTYHLGITTARASTVPYCADCVSLSCLLYPDHVGRHRSILATTDRCAHEHL